MKQLFLSLTNNSHYKGPYEETADYIQLDWGKYDYSVSKSQQEPDYNMLVKACSEFNSKYFHKYFALPEYGDKHNTVHLYTLKGLTENETHYEQVLRSHPSMAKQFKSAGLGVKEIDDKLKAETKALNAKKKAIKLLTAKLGFEVTDKMYEAVKRLLKPSHGKDEFIIRLDNHRTADEKIVLNSAKEVFDCLASDKIISKLTYHSKYEPVHSHKATVYIGQNYFSIECLFPSWEPKAYLNIAYVHFPSETKEGVKELYIKAVDQLSKLYFELK